MEELVSEKHFRLIRQRDALKKEIAMNNKRIEFYTLKIQDLKDEKEDIDFKIKWCKMGNLAYFLDEMPQTLNGKTDLRNLPEPILITEYIAPENDVEAFFANCFTHKIEVIL